MNLKKKIIVLSAVGLMAFSASTLAFAATPAPAADTAQQTPQATIIPAAGGVQNNNGGAALVNDKYLTKGGAAFWIIFTIVLNGALSFWIGNRFYRLARKDNHVSAEIRALRRDIDEKFAKSIDGFAEQEVDIENLNESLAMDGEGIRMSERQPVMREISPEEEERFRKWEAAQTKQRRARQSAANDYDEDFEDIKKSRRTAKDDFDEELDDMKRINRKNYQPRRSNDEEFDEDLGETKEIKVKNDSVKSKAKEILGDIFPFKED